MADATEFVKLIFFVNVFGINGSNGSRIKAERRKSTSLHISSRIRFQWKMDAIERLKHFQKNPQIVIKKFYIRLKDCKPNYFIAKHDHFVHQRYLLFYCQLAIFCVNFKFICWTYLVFAIRKFQVLIFYFCILHATPCRLIDWIEMQISWNDARKNKTWTRKKKKPLIIFAL